MCSDFSLRLVQDYRKVQGRTGSLNRLTTSLGYYLFHGLPIWLELYLEVLVSAFLMYKYSTEHGIFLVQPCDLALLVLGLFLYTISYSMHAEVLVRIFITHSKAVVGASTTQ